MTVPVYYKDGEWHKFTNDTIDYEKKLFVRIPSSEEIKYDNKPVPLDKLIEYIDCDYGFEGNCGLKKIHNQIFKRFGVHS